MQSDRKILALTETVLIGLRNPDVVHRLSFAMTIITVAYFAELNRCLSIEVSNCILYVSDRFMWAVLKSNLKRYYPAVLVFFTYLFLQ